jgi:hypothetical protein
MPVAPHVVPRVKLRSLAVCASMTLVAGQLMAQQAAPASHCEARSGAVLNPVIELYTSEGCSSCPPADQWLSTLKAGQARTGAVVQAFHVGYWDYIGWVDRFAAPAHTQRQREVALSNRLRNIYTPQVVRNGKDWRGWPGSALSPGKPGDEPSRAAITLRRTGTQSFEAVVQPAEGVQRWAAYWTVTEHGHSSRVKAGENRGEYLQHDFVVRQYTPVGEYRGGQTLRLETVAPLAAHARQVNLVVYEPESGKPLQGLSAVCS